MAVTTRALLSDDWGTQVGAKLYLESAAEVQVGTDQFMSQVSVNNPRYYSGSLDFAMFAPGLYIVALYDVSAPGVIDSTVFIGHLYLIIAADATTVWMESAFPAVGSFVGTAATDVAEIDKIPRAAAAVTAGAAVRRSIGVLHIDETIVGDAP